MTKIIKNTTLSKDESKEIKPNKLAEQVIFTPSANQSKIKARFWTRYQPGPFSSPENMTMAEALEVTGSAQLRKWWAVPGFTEWFMNRDEERERLKYLFNKGLDTMESMLDNPDTNANAKANLIKMLAEMNGYLGKKPVEKFADEDINKMSENQLKTFLEKKGVKIVEERIIETTGRNQEGNKDDSQAEEGSHPESPSE